MTRRPLPPTYFIVAVFLMIALHRFVPVESVIVMPWNLVGLVPFAVGAALNLAADRSFKRRNTTVKPFEISSALITDGVFSASRNPMYLGMVLILAGIGALVGSVTPWMVVPVFAVVVERAFIVPEERMLEETFGRTYLEYKSRVRRWI